MTDDGAADLGRAAALYAQGQHEAALTAYDRILADAPGHADALRQKGTLLWEMGRRPEGLAATEAAIAARPDFLEAIYNQAAMLQQLHRLSEAVAGFEAVLALNPGFVPALNNLAGALQALGRNEEALAICDRALKIQPQGRHHYNRGLVLSALGRHEEAFGAHAKALVLEPRHPDAFGCMAGAALRLCDWPRIANLKPQIEQHVAQNRSLISPLVFLGYSDDPALQLSCARFYSAQYGQPAPAPAPQRRDKIKLAYVSADLRDHPVGHLIAGLIEAHDRTRFEIIGVSLSGGDGSAARTRLTAAFDRFIDAENQSEDQTAALMREMGIDIAIDLMGHTQGARPRIFAQRAAPLQVGYLGWSATMGGKAIDYILADATSLPFALQPFFPEKIVHLPGCFLPMEATALPPPPPRSEAGLPEDGFVFCCFNNAWKITEAVFAGWMRLLAAVPGSVLWLTEDRAAMGQLQRAAAAQDIAPERLIFAPRLSRQDHLARLQLADVFLDTLPYNAHSTAADALRAGVPVITRPGLAFAARIAASLLTAQGLGELVTANAAHYEALALRLAREPKALADLKARMAMRPLFDSLRPTRAIETAYRRMQDIALAGEPPKGFAVSLTE